MKCFAPATLFLTVCLANAATATPPAPPPPKLANVITSCTVPNTVALTFDDGPYIYEPEIVKTLDAAGAKGTFFLNGNLWDCIYDDANIKNIRDTFAKGHMIGSHTWSHPYLTQLNQTTLESEIDRATLAFQRILGVTPAFLRPPYGSYNDTVRAVAASRGLTLVNWDFQDGDATGSTVEESEQDYTDLANQRPATILALNHEPYQTTAEQVLPFALETLRAAGYTKFVTVAECLGMKPYQKVGRPQKKDASWTCN